MSRVVVAGGAGFLGSHLCDRLIARGDSVVCLDDLSTGSKDNVAHLLGHDRFRLVVTDVSEKVELDDDDPVDARVPSGLAGLAPGVPGPAASTRWPSAARAPAACSSWRAPTTRGSSWPAPARSTATPKCTPRSSRYRGNVDPTGPRSVYDEAKRFAESLTMAMHRTHGVSVGIARIFNTYGPRLAPGDGRVVSNFIAQALRGDPLTVYGDGTQTRSLCYVDDEIAGLVALLDSVADRPRQHREPRRADRCSSWPTSCWMSPDRRRTSSFEPLPTDDPTRRCPDITLARPRSAGSPRRSCAEGIERTIEYFARKVKQAT